jgi:hypothetical protein
MKKILVVLVNYNGLDDTKECINSLNNLSLKDENVTVLVIDNGSDTIINNYELRIKNFKKQITIQTKRTEENLGFTGANNIALKKAIEEKFDYVLLLNNDTIVHPVLITNLLDTFDQENIGIAGAKIYFAKGNEFHKQKYSRSDLGKVLWYAGGHIDWDNVYLSHRGVDEVDNGQYDTQEETDFITGCCMMIKRTVIEKIGLLDNRYFLYLEDADLCMRAKNEGYKTVYNPKAVLWHKNAQSTGKPGSETHVYYQTRNRLIFGMKYAPLRVKTALVRESIRMVAGGGVRKKAVIDYYLRRFGKQIS